MAYNKVVNGQLVEMLPEEVAAWEAEQAAYVLPAPDPLRNLQPDQFHAMLNLSGYLPDIEAVIAAEPDPQSAAAASAKLRYATYFSRTDPLVDNLATAVGISSAELDTMWEYAHNF